MAANTKITGMFKVGYAYQGPNNAMRTGALLIRADSPQAARINAQAQLNKDHDWYKITKISSVDSDHAQQSL